ncbi:hypothetical protein D3C78_1334940 [compost metagenome]
MHVVVQDGVATAVETVGVAARRTVELNRCEGLHVHQPGGDQQVITTAGVGEAVAGGAQAEDQNVVAFTAIQLVGAGAAGQDVVAVLAEEDVVTVPAIELIVSSPAAQIIVAGACRQHVVAGIAM